MKIPQEGLAEYYSKKCPACSYVENNPDILPEIKMRYTLKKFNVHYFRYLDKVKEWREWSGGKIPSMRLVGNERVVELIGPKSIEWLAGKCREWLDASNKRRLEIEPVAVNIDATDQKGGESVGTN